MTPRLTPSSLQSHSRCSLEEHLSPKEAGSNPVTDIIGLWCNGSIDGSNPFGVGSNPTGPAYKGMGFSTA